MLVTAIPRPNTRISAVRFPAAPRNSTGAQGRDQAQACRERQHHAEPGDQPHRAHRIALQEPAHLRTGREHQQQQPELINGTQRSGRHPGGWENPMLDVRCDRAQDRGAEQDAPGDLPDHPRLPEPGEQISHAMRADQQNRQRDQKPGQVNISETQRPPMCRQHAETGIGRVLYTHQTTGVKRRGSGTGDRGPASPARPSTSAKSPASGRQCPVAWIRNDNDTACHRPVLTGSSFRAHPLGPAMEAGLGRRLRRPGQQ